MKCARWFSNSSGEPNRFRFADFSTEERILLLVALGRWCAISARLLRAQRGIPLVTHRVYKVTYSLSLDRLLCVGAKKFSLVLQHVGSVLPDILVMALLLRTIPGELTTRRETNEAMIFRGPLVARQYPAQRMRSFSWEMSRSLAMGSTTRRFICR